MEFYLHFNTFYLKLLLPQTNESDHFKIMRIKYTLWQASKTNLMNKEICLQQIQPQVTVHKGHFWDHEATSDVFGDWQSGTPYHEASLRQCLFHPFEQSRKVFLVFIH